MKIKHTLFAFVAMILIVFMCLSLAACGANKAEKLAEDYMTACYKEFSASKIKGMLNETVVMKQVESSNMSVTTDFNQQMLMLQSMLDGQKKTMQEKSMSIDFEITGSKELSGKEFDKIKKYYKDDYGLELESVTVVDVKSTMTEKGKEPQIGDTEVYVTEVDGKLYIDMYAASYETE